MYFIGSLCTWSKSLLKCMWHWRKRKPEPMYWENPDVSNGDWNLETWTWSWNFKWNKPICPHFWLISLFLMYSCFIFWKYCSQGQESDMQGKICKLVFYVYSPSVIFKLIFLMTYIKISIFGQYWIQSMVRKIKMELISYLLHQNWNFRS